MALVIREPTDAQRRDAHAGAYNWCSTGASHLATDGRSLRLRECR
jgi:hypothetical protein